MFNRKSRGDAPAPTIPVRPGPRLTDWYYQDIAARLASNGGSDSRGEIAFGVGNAVYSTIGNYLDRLGDARGRREFDRLFADRTPNDTDSADRMIDWIAAREGGSAPDFVDTLLGRLAVVLGRPA